MFYITDKINQSLIQTDLFEYLNDRFHQSNNEPLTVTINGVRDLKTDSIREPITLPSQPKQQVLRNFIAFRFKYDNVDDLQDITDTMQDSLTIFEDPDYISYVDPDHHESVTLILLSQYLGRQDYRKLLNQLFKIDTLKPIKSKMPKSDFGMSPIEIPLTTPTKWLKSKITTDGAQKPGLLVSDFIEVKNAILQHNTAAQYDVEKLQAALDDYIDNHDIPKIVNDKTELHNLTSSINASFLRHLINKDFIQLVASRLIENCADNLRTKITDSFKNTYETLRTDPALQTQAPPLSDYFPMYKQTGHTAQTLAQQFQNALSADTNPDPDMNLADAGNLVKSIYPPALIDQPGSQRDNVVIFNPLTGVWSHDDDLFANLVNVVRPYTSKQQLETIISTFASDAANRKRIFKPYSGSRYLLFLNGVLDVSEMKFHHLDEDFVRDLHFTERCQLHIDYVDNPPLPQLQNERTAGGDWNPKDFINAYAENDPEKLRFFLFGLSLGLFGGHNFGVHFDIKGVSRWGKSSLAEIYKGLYNNNITIIPFTSLNGRFPFTDYKISNSLIWINECNEETDPLNDEYGTITYDGLADNEVRFQVKSKGDVVLENPPQVYIDGTNYVKANDMSTGPLGRTIAYQLPKLTQKLRDQAYALNIVNDLRDPQVLQWLVYQMIDAYRTTVPKQRQSNLKLNLSLPADEALLPPIARTWRKELGAGNDDLNHWFAEQIEPYLTMTEDANDPNMTIMHKNILYTIYKTHYIEETHDERAVHIMQPAKFNRQISKVIADNGWVMQYDVNDDTGKRKRHVRNSLNRLHFDWNQFTQDWHLPKEYKDTNDLPYPFGVKTDEWFSLYHHPEVNDDDDDQDTVDTDQ